MMLYSGAGTAALRHPVVQQLRPASSGSRLHPATLPTPSIIVPLELFDSWHMELWKIKVKAVSNPGSIVLGISKFQMLNDPNKDTDYCPEDNSKVEEILLSYKEIKPLDRDGRRTRPELCSKWLALLTMEKACLSAVVLEGI